MLLIDLHKISPTSSLDNHCVSCTIIALFHGRWPTTNTETNLRFAVNPTPSHMQTETTPIIMKPQMFCMHLTVPPTVNVNYEADDSNSSRSCTNC